MLFGSPHSELALPGILVDLPSCAASPARLDVSDSSMGYGIRVGEGWDCD